MNTPFDLTSWFVHMLTGSPDTVMDWRCIHDTDGGVPAHNFRGTLSQCWATLQDYNSRGYGIHVTINAMDGVGRKLPNVQFIRAQVVDLDNVMNSHAGYQRAIATEPRPHMAVQSSPNKFHLYWLVDAYTGNEFFTEQQRKLKQLYDGDPGVIDAAHTLRVPGFNHLKAEPHLVTCWQIHDGPRWSATAIAQSLAHINVIEHLRNRKPLGTPEMAAPSLEWLAKALQLLNPNGLNRHEWMVATSAFKQAGWTHADEDTLLRMWLEWCSQYEANDYHTNMKMWRSLTDTEVGWTTFERITPIKAYLTFGQKAALPASSPPPAATTPAEGVAAMPSAPPTRAANASEVTTDAEILSAAECEVYFRDCYFVSKEGKIVSKDGRFMNSTQFNGLYGGKIFIISTDGKVTDEPWKAALRSTVCKIPTVDHIRFLPDRPTFDIIIDGLGRKGLNTYIPARVDARPGDVSLWLEWFDKILPNKADQRVFFEYLAHAVKFPGHKIPWAPMLQSVEGIGKTIFREVMAHALGDMYVYSPKAPELVKSGSTFNAWMRGKLLITVDEIKIDERRELIEILKPMITDNRVEIQAKGVDQDIEDNPANWLFFSNYKDAIPINQNGRRYAIFYSALQSVSDLVAAGMDTAYFNRLWSWLREGGGLSAVAYWLLNYPIERGGLPVRAPETSSHVEALTISRSPMEVVIADNIIDGTPGFKGGYVSTLAAVAKAKAAGIRNPTARTVQVCLEGMGYVRLGRASRAFFQEGLEARAEIYALRSDMNIEHYGQAQGY